MVLLDNLIENKITSDFDNMSLPELYKAYKEIMYNIKELGGIYDEDIVSSIGIVRAKIQDKLFAIAYSVEKEDLIKMLTERFDVKKICNSITFNKSFVFDDYRLELEICPVFDVKYSRFKINIYCASKSTPDVASTSLTLSNSDLPNILAIKRSEQDKIKIVIGDNYIIADCFENISDISNIRYYYRDTFVNNIN